MTNLTNLRKRLPVSAILFVLVVLAMSFQVVRSLAAGPTQKVQSKDIAGATREAKPPAGTTDEKAALPESGVIGGNGIVEPADRETRVAAAVPGLITKIAVKEGDRVTKDDVIVELESSVERAAVKAAEADVAAAHASLDKAIRGQRAEDKDASEADSRAAKARAEQSRVALARTEQLVKGGAATVEELDRARLSAAADEATARASEARFLAVKTGSRSEDIAAMRAQLASAEGRLEESKSTLERRRVRAPISGEVLQVKSRVGEYYTPGADALLVVGDTSKLRVRMDVDERDIGRVKMGALGYAIADAAPGKRLTGKVVEIGRRMGRKNVRTDDPVERLDTKILEVVMELDDASGTVVPGLRVTSFLKE